MSNVWVSGVKLWSFPAQMWSFTSRHRSKGRCYQSTRKEEITRKASHFQVICGIKWKNLHRIILFQKLDEDYGSARVQFQKLLSSTTWLEARLPKSWIMFEQSLSVLSKTLFCWRPWCKQVVRPLLKNCEMILPFTLTTEYCQHQQFPEILGTNFQVATTIPEKDWGNVRQSVLLPKI